MGRSSSFLGRGCGWTKEGELLLFRFSWMEEIMAWICFLGRVLGVIAVGFLYYVGGGLCFLGRVILGVLWELVFR